MSTTPLILPRPLSINGQTWIPGPSEASFVATFGSHLPPAKWLDSNYGQFAYYDQPPVANVAGPVQHILFIHGIGTPALGLLPLSRTLQNLNPGAHVVIFDLWGHGLSSTPLVPHVPGLFHSQIIQLMGQLQWKTAHILGFSFGGTTAASFTALYPNLVESVTLVAPAGLIRSDSFSDEQKTFLIGGGGVEDAARNWILGIVNDEPLVAPKDWEERFARGEISGEPLQIWERQHHPGHLPSIVSMFRDGGVLDNHEAFRKAAATGIKSLVVLGERDNVCAAQDIKELGWNEVIVIADAGHALVRERTAEVAAPISQLWKSLM